MSCQRPRCFLHAPTADVPARAVATPSQIINMALVVAQRMRIPFLFPVVLPPSVRHNLTTDFADMFTDFDPEDGTPPTTHVP